MVRDIEEEAVSTTTLEVRFPWGRYHANRWGRNVNEAAVDWPPSPWRILRALYASWRWHVPDLDEQRVLGLLHSLSRPPRYRLPPFTFAHSRHYYPDMAHRRGVTKNTDKTLDAFVVMPRDARVLVSWDRDTSDTEREVLGRLADGVRYLGRADSIAEVRLVAADEVVPDDGWLEPWARSETSVPCLTPSIEGLDLEALLLRPSQVRGQRMLVPQNTTWVDYPAPVPVPAETTVREQRRSVARTTMVTAVRFTLHGTVAPADDTAVTVADILHKAVCRRVEGNPMLTGFGVDGRPLGGLHEHAHWLAFGRSGRRMLSSVLLWVPGGIDRAVASELASAPFQLWAPDHLKLPTGLRAVVEAVGDPASVAPEVAPSEPHLMWRSLTPYAPTRRDRRAELIDHLLRDLRREAGYRGLPEVVAAEQVAGGWLRYRRARAHEPLSKARRAFGLRVQFAEPVHGPIALGQLSHFGLGLFVPDGLAERPLA